MKAYAIPGSSRCIVKLLDKYLDKLPLDAQYVYMWPLDKITNSPTIPWYTKQRMGYNTLEGFIPKFFAASGLKGLHTNHSLRTTSITRMFKADVPEKIVAEWKVRTQKFESTSYVWTHVTFTEAGYRGCNNIGWTLFIQW